MLESAVERVRDRLPWTPRPNLTAEVGSTAYLALSLILWSVYLVSDSKHHRVATVQCGQS